MPGELAVVLSGGGAKGAFQVGALAELADRGVRFRIFAGVSTGAIQALGGAQDDLPGLLQAWLTIRSNRDIYRDRGGILGGLLGNDSLYDASPLRARLRAFANEARLRATGNRLLLGVVNLTTGEYRSVAENAPNIADWVYASAAMPVFFRPFLTRDAQGREEQWVDGGTRNVTPLDAALEQRPRAVLAILASPAAPQPAPDRLYTALVPVALRAVSILQSEVVRNDTANANLINDLILARRAQARAFSQANIPPATAARILAPLDAQLSRYHFAPIRLLGPETEIADTLDFDPARIRAGIDAGRRAVATQWPTLEPFLTA